tara:strand:- start:73 stop:2064 length:1992 start_codon:yes stop_codon:yes gene_type:complete
MNILLYDNINKKNIKINNFDIETKKKIINDTYSIKSEIDEQFIKLFSDDKNYIPLFDLLNESIKFVKKNFVFKAINQNHYRLINDELIDFFKRNNINHLFEKIKLFDLKIIHQNFLTFIYYDSEEIGSNLSFFRNPAFIKSLDVKPYLKKSAIINTALNLGLIKPNNLPYNKNLEDLYIKIKPILFTEKILVDHIKLINEQKMNSIINFFSVYGSSLINDYLRGNFSYYDQNIEQQINKMYNLISKTKKIEDNKLIFRFISEDSFLNLTKVGDLYENESFISCTRKPSINIDNFGYIILKIILPKNIDGIFLSIENDSAFYNEKEIILKPGIKFKLKTIDDDVDFYLFDDKKVFSSKIYKRYELEIKGISNKLSIPKYEFKKIPELNIMDIILDNEIGEEKAINIIKNFFYVNKSCNIIFPNNIKKKFYFYNYDSSNAYAKFHYYKITNGFILFSFNENNELDCFIELGDIIIVNYPGKYIRIYPHPQTTLIVSCISYIFNIDKVKIFPEFISLNSISKINDPIFQNIKINKIIYNIINNLKLDLDYQLYNRNEIYEFFDNIVDPKTLNYNIAESNNISYKNLFLQIIKENPILIKYYNKSLPNNIYNCHYDFYPNNYLISNNIIQFNYNNYDFYSTNYDFDKSIFSRINRIRSTSVLSEIIN